ncbi:putative sulfate exporter family transporter [Alphaproteobacteria bacterium]|nr:putative sulfate exporter family transporter [Alphaproteobacteria bacterium]
MSLFKDVKSHHIQGRIKLLFPGVLAAVTVAIASRFLADQYGSPIMLFALLLGMAFHFLYQDKICCHGIDFASKNVLQFGVALLGLGVTIDQVVSIGIVPLVVVMFAIFLTLISGPLLARFFKRGWRLGLLTSGAVAICGASAALAIASVLPKNEYSERNTIFTVISVTTLSTMAMIFYPMIVYFMELDDFAAGFFIGATIHDVAQVIGAGYSISETAGDTAAIVKMVRVAMLVPVVMALTIFFRKESSSANGIKVSFPFFVIGFIVFIFIGSISGFPVGLKLYILNVSSWCLVTAIAAIGMKTALASLKTVGGQAITIICVETVLLALFVLLAIHLFIV